MRFKFLILVILGVTLGYGLCFSQAYCPSGNDPCCNAIISTGLPNAQNTERPNLKNNFDWTNEYWNIFIPFENKYQGSIKSPFYSEDAYLSNINYSSLLGKGVYPTKDNLDFQPEDGWELVNKDDGYLVDQVTIRANDNGKRAPHVVLYNKYRGLLRIISGMPDGVANGQDQVLLELSSTQNNNQLPPNGLFNKMQAPIKALDVQSDIMNFVKGANPALGGAFVVADFPINYDPCVCNFQNYFKVRFYSLYNMQIQLGGRLIGTSVQLDKSGNSPLLNGGQDFLTAVASNGVNVVNGGELTYSNIDALVAKYKVELEPNNTDPVSTFFFNTFKSGVIAGLEGIGKAADSELNNQASIFYKTQFGGAELLTLAGKVYTLPEKLNLGIAVASQGAKKLAGILFPASNKASKPLPQISFIEGEMVLSGNLTGKAPINGGVDINFAIPGSKYTTDPARTPDPKYPMYNEPLGLFSLLETPKGTVQYVRSTQKVNGTVNVDPMNPLSEWGYESLTFNVNRSSIKYAFNPSAEIDVEKTKIYASLELEEVNGKTISDQTYNRIKEVLGCPPMDDPYINQYSCSVLKGVDYVNEGEFVPNLIKGTGSTQKYSTSLMPIECLTNSSQTIKFNNLLLKQINPEMISSNLSVLFNGCPPNPAYCKIQYPSYFNNDKKLVLKLHIDYVFKKNKYGKINRYFEILTYPVSLTNGTASVSPTSYEKSDVTYSNGNFGTSVLNAYNTININGKMDLSKNLDLFFDPDETTESQRFYSFNAGSEINLVDGTEVFGEGEFNISTSNLCGDKILPVTSDYINTFCTTKYFAKNFANTREGYEEESLNSGKRFNATDINMKVFPNPIVTKSSISYFLPEAASVKLYIVDILGNPVRILVDENSHPFGSFQKVFSSEAMNSGTYFCNLEINGEKHVQRLVVVK